MKVNKLSLITFVFSVILAYCIPTVAQELYSARGYWTESNKDTYKKIKEKMQKGEVLADNESAYFTDYEAYLDNYYKRMSEAEKMKYEQMKSQWDQELNTPAPARQDDFDFRPRDRFTNGIYGLYYGSSFLVAFQIDGPAAIGIPLITAGLWQLGPIINPKKYEGITYNTVRASNSGKFLGLLYGASLGLALGGDSEGTGRLAFGLSSVGSIALGEVGFQYGKRNKLTEGHVEMMRHYGLLVPGVTLLGLGAAQTDNLNLIGASILAGGVGGLLIGNSVSKKYSYTAGDVNAIGSFTLISTGLGATLAAATIDTGESSGLLLIPAATAIAGTIYGQRMVKGVKLTRKQGSTINLTSGGAALIGLGIVAMTSTESPGVIIGVPSVLALVAHQAVFRSYKTKNLTDGLKLGLGETKSTNLSLRITPESYLTNKKLSDRIYMAGSFPRLAEPIVKLKLTF
jgi:hypothetical protein